MALAGTFPAQGFRIPHVPLVYRVAATAAQDDGRVSWPSNIKKGDLLLGYHLSDNNAVFSGNGGLALFISRDNVSSAASGTGIICGKVADGTESGAIGGLSNQASPYCEVIEVLRFNRPLVSVTLKQAEGQVRNTTPVDANLSAVAAGTTQFVAGAYGARMAEFIEVPGFSEPYDHGDSYSTAHTLKTRGKMTSIYEDLPAITLSLGDKGFDSMVLGVRLELT